MTQYKPLLDVIKEMEDGDIADCEHSHFRSIYKCESRFYVIFPNEEPHTKHKYDMCDSDFEKRYRIRPRYVGWREAFKAVEKGEHVFYLDDTNTLINLGSINSIGFLFDHNSDTFNDLLQGKFIIEGEAE